MRFVQIGEAVMQQAETIIPLTGSQSDGAAADKIGNGIIAMLKQTAHAARENVDRAVRTSQGLAEQLQQSEEKIRRLEEELKHFQDRTARAESWLAQIQKCAVEDFEKLQHETKVLDTVLRTRNVSAELH